MTNPRKISLLRETITADRFGQPCAPLRRVALIAVFVNPLAGRFVADLTPLFEIGAHLGATLADEAAEALGAPAESYGKAAIVGGNGDMEHGGAIIHPRLGKPMRAAVGGGAAVIPSNVKIGGPGTAIDMPLGHKDNPWSFDHFDTMTISVADAPAPDEIAMILGYASRGRPLPRCGSGPVTA